MVCAGCQQGEHLMCPENGRRAAAGKDPIAMLGGQRCDCQHWGWAATPAPAKR